LQNFTPAGLLAWQRGQTDGATGCTAGGGTGGDTSGCGAGGAAGGGTAAGGAAAVKGAPQALQNFAPGALLAWQRGQPGAGVTGATESGLPQALQNLAPSELSA